MNQSRKNFIFLCCYSLWVSGIILVLGTTTSSCASSKQPASQELVAELATIPDKNFNVEITYVYPLGSSAYLGTTSLGFTQVRGNSPTQINVDGDGHHITVNGDSVKVHLPYFGIRDVVTNYNAIDNGILLDTDYEDFKTWTDRKGKHIEFFAKDGFERFRIQLTFKGNKSALISLFSPQRDVIRYSGIISETLPEEG